MREWAKDLEIVSFLLPDGGRIGTSVQDLWRSRARRPLRNSQRMLTKRSSWTPVIQTGCHGGCLHALRGKVTSCEETFRVEDGRHARF